MTNTALCGYMDIIRFLELTGPGHSRATPQPPQSLYVHPPTTIGTALLPKTSSSVTRVSFRNTS